MLAGCSHSDLGSLPKAKSKAYFQQLKKRLHAKIALLQVSGRRITLPMALLLAPSVLPLQQTCRHKDQSTRLTSHAGCNGSSSTPGPWCLCWFLWQHTFAPAHASPAQQSTGGQAWLAVDDLGLLTQTWASGLTDPVLQAQPMVPSLAP